MKILFIRRMPTFALNSFSCCCCSAFKPLRILHCLRFLFTCDVVFLRQRRKWKIERISMFSLTFPVVFTGTSSYYLCSLSFRAAWKQISSQKRAHFVPAFVLESVTTQTGFFAYHSHLDCCLSLACFFGSRLQLSRKDDKCDIYCSDESVKFIWSRQLLA